MIWGSNHLCLCQGTEIPTGCSVDRYGIAFNRDCRPVRNSSLLLHCYWVRWTIQLLEGVRPVGFRMATSNSVNRLWNKANLWWVSTRKFSSYRNCVEPWQVNKYYCKWKRLSVDAPSRDVPFLSVFLPKSCQMTSRRHAVMSRDVMTSHCDVKLCHLSRQNEDKIDLWNLHRWHH